VLLRPFHYTIWLVKQTYRLVFDVCPLSCDSLILSKAPFIPCLLQSLGQGLPLKAFDLPLAVLRNPLLHPGDLLLSHGLDSIHEGATIGCSQGDKLL
jgi:hypothetical protein